ncbi:hypothetical protein SDC9_148359 [bioreactor metagenome]|uniref:Uncharacterized protein n=1 Tax=bioreactor metagenome TaxID=1076179 RepID=A0A645EI78_9ZZZZ
MAGIDHKRRAQRPEAVIRSGGTTMRRIFAQIKFVIFDGAAFGRIVARPVFEMKDGPRPIRMRPSPGKRVAKVILRHQSVGVQ